MSELTKRQLEILQHSLGVDQYGRGQMYRNHFCAGGGDEDVGKAAMLAQSPKPPKLTRSQERYRRYLKADTGFSFREFLEMEKVGR